nr:hypothetical protein [Tanacetum cinerariifolium]
MRMGMRMKIDKKRMSMLEEMLKELHLWLGLVLTRTSLTANLTTLVGLNGLFGEMDPIKMANNLMDQKVRVYAANKLRTRGSRKTTHEIIVSLPYCNKYKLHHDGTCTVKCANCKKVGHIARECKAAVTATTQISPGANQRTITCYEYGKQGHFRSDYPKLKNQSRGKQVTNGEAQRRAFALGGGEANQDSNVVTVIKESLVKTKLKGVYLELKRRHLKNIILCYYMQYQEMKIRRISASSTQETCNDQFHIRHITLQPYSICTAGRLRKKYRLSLKNDMPPRNKPPLH